MTRAIHVNSTAPFFEKGGKDYSISGEELLCTALSALYWKKYNGSISIVTDSIAYEYYNRLGLISLWDEALVALPEHFAGIDSKCFWAAGKIFALYEVSVPVALLDTDFIVWKKLELSDEVVAAHREELMPDVYPNKDYFPAGNTLPEFDWSVMPLNTAFLYIPDEDFKQFFTAQSIAFMKSTGERGDWLCHMVFAEQRLLAMAAEKTGMSVRTLIDHKNLFAPQQDFTHLWGAKRQFAENADAAKEFRARCLARLKTDFPDYAEKLEFCR